ncbi:MAG: HAD-IB family hydrolase [Gammaproteobacteria bacterium]|nr:HAD-IB family hydrolase [Gammaproteobacteria bacterium]MDH5777540.1 HAD-IB family hydrolase [Gammaproteobacteria bacterium]
MALAIFDLDNTLLNGDSDYLWGRFLANKGYVDGDEYERQNRQYYEDYKAGQLDIYEFLRFSLNPLTEIGLDTLNKLHQEFMQTEILPIITPASRQLIDKHRQCGDVLMIITATNRFITEPIAKELGIEHLIATEPEITDGQYTGNVSGTPCFKEGKIKRLNEWLAQNRIEMKDSWFYSDSLNDIPLLEQVDNPVAVDPDDTLTQHAEMKGWPIISLR